jgi:hypothetical protein
MRRTLIATSLCLALLVAPAEARSAPRQVRIAIGRAKREMREVSLPPGSRLVASYPAEGGEPLGPEPKLVGSHTVERRQSWTVPRPPRDVFRWVASRSGESFHRPHGERLCGSFFGGEAICPSPSLVADEPGGDGILGARITVSATPLPGGRSRVQVAVLTTWVEPRPAAERVPAGVTRIQLVVERAGSVRSLAITARARVATIVGKIESLRVVQFKDEEEESLPELGAPPPSTVRLLARSTQREGEEVVRFSVRGRAMAPFRRGRRFLRSLIPERRRAR